MSREDFRIRLTEPQKPEKEGDAEGAEPPASDLSRLGKGLGIRQMCVRVCGLRKIVSAVSRLTCSVEGRFFTLLRGELSEVILLCFNTV
jgi:hypothetical protein